MEPAFGEPAQFRAFEERTLEVQCANNPNNNNNNIIEKPFSTPKLKQYKGNMKFVLYRCFLLCVDIPKNS